MGYDNFLRLQIGEVVHWHNSLFFLSVSVSQRLCGSTDFSRINHGVTRNVHVGVYYSVQAGQWVGILTGISCAEKTVPCPMSEKGKDEVVLLGEDKAVLHLFGKDQPYLLNHYGHKVRITGDLKEEMGKKTVDVTNFEHLEVVIR